jgi:squalene cyclase
VQKAGDESKAAKKEVDKGVGAADTALDPDGQWGKEDGEKRKEEVGGTHDKIENVEALLEFEVYNPNTRCIDFF